MNTPAKGHSRVGKAAKAEQYLRYPWPSVVTYNGATILHFLLGGIAIAIGYDRSPRAALTFGVLYFILSFIEMYVVMPLTVCPNCSYHRVKDALCISGLNLLSRKIAKAGRQKDFPQRAEGVFCQNNLYLASLIVPIVAVIPALFINFSGTLFIVFLALIALLVFRFFVVFPKIACLHCREKHVCPQAAAMGVRER